MAEWRVGDFKAQALSNTAWAFATASRSEAQLFAALARTADWRICAFKAQDLANTAWAFATADQKDASLFTALAVAAERRMDGFNPQGLANTAWALTDSAACTLGSWRSEALGGGAEGDASTSDLIKKGQRPKLGHFSLPNPVFLQI